MHRRSMDRNQVGHLLVHGTSSPKGLSLQGQTRGLAGTLQHQTLTARVEADRTDCAGDGKRLLLGMALQLPLAT